MIEFGKELRAAREAKGLTTADIARQTHMMTAMAEDLENENFSRIVAPIYGRGFVKLYCEAVGLDPKPYIAEFMDIYNGNRDPAIRERPTTKSAVNEPEPTPEAVAPAAEVVEPEPEPQPKVQPTLFDPPSAWRPPEPKRTPVAPLSSEPEAPAANRLSRYSSPFQDRLKEFPDLLPTLLRWGVVAFVAILILWGVIAGIGALYRATNSVNEETVVITDDPFSDDVSTTAATKEAPSPAAQTPTPRTPITIPPLYID